MENKNPTHWDIKQNALVLMSFFAILGLFYWKIIFGGSVFVFVDASRFFYPLWKWGAGVLAQGFIPLWNPDAQFGTPYFADPQMAYAYPPVPIFYSYLSPTHAFSALIILHHFWTLLGFWFFARTEGFSSKVSFLGSLAFGFSLHVVCSSWTPVALMTIGWLPWVFLTASKVYRGEKGGLLYLSFAWAMQLSAGYPVLVYLTGLALGLHFLWRTFRVDVSGVVHRSQFAWLGWFVLAGFIAVLYNLVWGLPFAEFLNLSNYENGAGKFHDLNWRDFGTALNPFLQGHPLRSDYQGPHYWVSTYFIGLPILCLLLWGVIRRGYQKTSPVLFMVFLILSLGILGAGKVLKMFLPGYSLVVHSGFWISILLFFAVWMAMESLESLLKERGLDKGRWFWLSLVGLVYLSSLLLGAPLFPGDFFFSFALLILAVFLNQAMLRWGCILAATLLSLGSSADSLNLWLDRGYYEKPPVVLTELSKPGRLFFTPPTMRDAGRLQGENVVQAYEAAKQKLYPNWPLAFGLEQAPLYNTIQLKSSFAWTFQAFQYSLQHSRSVLDYLNVRYVFGKNQFKDFKKVVNPSGLVEVSENPTTLPKWFFVSEAKAAGASIEEDFQKAAKTKMDYGKECFVDDASKAGLYVSRQSVLELPFKSQNTRVLDLKGKGKSFLVSSETAYPGWKYQKGDNGLAGDGWRAMEVINHAFRGVIVEDGSTNVIMSYRPASFRLGLFLSFLICGLWSSLLLKRIKT